MPGEDGVDGLAGGDAVGTGEGEAKVAGGTGAAVTAGAGGGQAGQAVTSVKGHV